MGPENSGRISRDGVLGMISAKRAETLLYEWVNLRDDIVVGERLLSRYPEVFVFGSKKESYRILRTVRDGLQKIWSTSDARQRDWDIFNLRNHYQAARTRENHALRDFLGSQTDIDFFPALPRLTAFEAAMFYLQTRLVHRMLACPNPECAARYFFRTRLRQKFCSPECADSSRTEAKRRWWNENRGKGARS